jgi:hypothetical protein
MTKGIIKNDKRDFKINRMFSIFYYDKRNNKIECFQFFIMTKGIIKKQNLINVVPYKI